MPISFSTSSSSSIPLASILPVHHPSITALILPSFPLLSPLMLHLLPHAVSPVAPIATIVSRATSITLTWRQPDDPFGIGAVDQYEVTYIYVGPCPAIVHKGTEVLDSSATALTLLGMQEFSTYNVTITSVKNGGSSVSNIQVLMSTAGKVNNIGGGGSRNHYFFCPHFLCYILLPLLPYIQMCFLFHTSSICIAPDAPPTFINEVARSPTSLTVGWSPVPCILQNSLITKYVIRYGLPYGAKATAETTVNFYTATRLIPFTSYMFEVAAVNSAGQRGPFSPPFIMDTKLGKFM